MTREEKLYSMTMVNLVEVANSLGIKIDKKGAKSKAVAKILEAEDKREITNPDNIPDVEYVAEVMEQKKDLGIECPIIDSYEIVDVDTEKELTDEQYAEIGKEIVEQAEKKAEKAEKAKKKTVDKVDVIAVVEDIAKALNLTYKRSRDGIGIFSNEKRVLDLWKRTDKVRVYMSGDDSKFNEISTSSLIEKLHDNPSKNAKLNKSFYVVLANVSSVLSLYFA